MMPIRRQRLLTFCAIVMVFMLYRVVQNSWDDSNTYAGLRNGKSPSAAQPPPDAKVDDEPVVGPAVEHPQQPPLTEDTDTPVKEGSDSKSSQYNQPTYEYEDDGRIKIPELKDKEAGKGSGSTGDSSKGSEETGGTYRESDGTDESAKDEAKGIKDSTSNEKTTPSGTTKDELGIQWQNPPNDETNKGIYQQPKVHWKKLPEHFPVPEESIAPLPTGKPKKIPKVQHEFGPEPEKAQMVRQTRQKRVRVEIERSWNSYKKYAWMHDELSPVSGTYRDPFCGWAATLVDSLDTLWISGLKDDFDQAAKAVEDIDFTWTTRNDIPVFETTIRYLGGLLSAFDLSGGHQGEYQILLDKAVELAEVLMGVFDTPNRMPLLYYSWMPEHASQPHRAGRVGVAELATLSMEFTRLSQLTKEDKYYDAINRITDGLVQMQTDGTHFPGLFPEGIDASGCNKTATTIRDNLSEAAQKQLDSGSPAYEPEGYVPELRSAEKETVENAAGSTSEKPARDNDRLGRRDLESGPKVTEEGEGRTIPGSEEPQPPYTADGRTSEWDCVPQGLVPSGYGYQSFHMGGGQDSAYEYFPKEYLLLGGLEPKYQKLYEDAVNAVNEWLLFRPMSDDDWDVLFPARVSTNGRIDGDLMPQFEISHLTCFIGGMYGLGGRIFGREQDVETAKKLTDGCVWAYQSMPSGLMPEAARVIPCADLDKCEFNQTLWYDHLDESKAWRELELARWERNEAELDEASQLGDAADVKEDSPVVKGTYNSDRFEEADVLKQTAMDYTEGSSELPSGSLRKRAAIPDQGADGEAESELPDSLKMKLGIETEEKDTKGSKNYKTDDDSKSGLKTDASKTSKTDQDSESELPGSLKTKLGMDVDEESTPSKPSRPAADDSTPKDRASKDSREDSEDQTEGAGQAPKYSTPQRMTSQRQKPPSHEDYVKEKIQNQGLPPGFTDVAQRNYILRPEAIESVWYMYRITGDSTWMDKGWDMFEATVRASRTNLANSAINDVTREVPELRDEMESFWIAETLKYYYLLFSEPDVISLDEWVLNTEAHPFRRPS